MGSGLHGCRDAELRPQDPGCGNGLEQLAHEAGLQGAPLVGLHHCGHHLREDGMMNLPQYCKAPAFCEVAWSFSAWQAGVHSSRQLQGTVMSLQDGQVGEAARETTGHL